jgi:hypothetical protein
MVCHDSTFVKVYSKHGRKGGISDRVVRAEKADR